MSRSSEIPILTSAHIGITTFHEELGTIQEEDFMSSAIDSSVIAEHSTFIPSAGELASSVIIPIQVKAWVVYIVKPLHYVLLCH